MKHLFSLLALSLALTGAARAQKIAEPDFVGEVVHVKADGTAQKLEKQRVVTKTKAGASMYLVGMGKVKTKMNIEGGTSPVRVPAGTQLRFVVRAVDNQSDPLSIISIFAFKASAKARKAEMSSLGTFGGATSNKLDYVTFEAVKYGENSYLITVPSVAPGEYGITVTNPNNQDEKSTIVSCFGAD